MELNSILKRYCLLYEYKLSNRNNLYIIDEYVKNIWYIECYSVLKWKNKFEKKEYYFVICNIMNKSKELLNGI